MLKRASFRFGSEKYIRGILAVAPERIGTPYIRSEKWKSTKGVASHYQVSPLNSSYKILNNHFVRFYSSLPEHIKVGLPALSPTMESGSIVSWGKKEGDKISEGDVLAVIETDKASMDFETSETGFMAKILVPAGTAGVPVGKLLCIIAKKEADIAAFKNFVDDAPAGAKAPAAAAPVAAAAAPSAPAPSAAPVTAKGRDSPIAKNLADAQSKRKGGASAAPPAKAATAAVSAPKGKPGKKPAAGPGPQQYTDIPLSNVRAVIAKRLSQSKREIPHYYLTVECQLDQVLKLRARLNKELEKQKLKLSVNDFVIKATASACRKIPESNAFWMETSIRQFDNVDVSIAVSTPTGLITPIVFSADRKGVVDISKEVKSLATKARENKLKPHEFQGGTVCVSNLGMFGVTEFCAVINPPQACILAVGTSSNKLVADKTSEKGFKEITVMKVTLSADHRVIDGAVAAQWLKYFREFIEDPSKMIV